MTPRTSQGAIERTIKLNQGAAYIWGAGQVDRHAEPDHARLPPQVPGADRPHLVGRLRRLHLRHQGRRADAAGQVVRPRPRRRHRPVHGRPVQQGPGDRAAPEELPRLLGRLDGHPLQERRLPRRAHTPAPRPSSSAGPAVLGRAANPQLWDSFKSDARHDPTTSSVVYQNLLGMLNTSSGPLKDKRVRQARGLRHRLRRADHGAEGVRTPSHRDHPARALGL